MGKQKSAAAAGAVATGPVPRPPVLEHTTAELVSLIANLSEREDSPSRLPVPLRLCQCERASIRFAAAESEGLARSILDRTSALTALAGLPAREDVRIVGQTTAPTEPRLAVAWGNGLRGVGRQRHGRKARKGASGSGGAGSGGRAGSHQTYEVSPGPRQKVLQVLANEGE